METGIAMCEWAPMRGVDATVTARPTFARLVLTSLRYLWALPNTALGLLLVPLVLATRGRARAVDGVLEVCGPVPSFLLRHLVALRGGALAMTLGHVVIGRDQVALDETRAHERAHVRQYERWGPAFLPAYAVAGLWALVARGGAYRGNHFECQAVVEATASAGAGT
jgi:hypothetical protein